MATGKLKNQWESSKNSKRSKTFENILTWDRQIPQIPFRFANLMVPGQDNLKSLQFFACVYDSHWFLKISWLGTRIFKIPLELNKSKKSKTFQIIPAWDHQILKSPLEFLDFFKFPYTSKDFWGWLQESLKNHGNVQTNAFFSTILAWDGVEHVTFDLEEAW